MGRNWGVRLAVAAGLVGAGGCASTSRPMLFHRNNNHAEQCCPPAPAPCSEGPMLGEMPAAGMPGPMMPGATMPGATMPSDVVVTPGMGLPPGTVTIPGGPSATPAPPLASPPVGPQPRTSPTAPTTQTGRTKPQ